MPRVEHVAGPGRFSHQSVGVSERGDEHDVPADAAEYLCDGLGYFERTGDIVLDDDDYTVEAADGLGELTYDELYDRATEADLDGRSEMDKAELIDALRED